jgi:hypothetical protein
MKDGIDFTTRFASNSQTSSANHHFNRGFINRVYEHFGSGSTTGAVEYTGADYVTYYTNGTQDYFLCYVRAAMYYTREEFQAKYPPETYPLINEKYELTVEYMKNVAGIDLVGIANGPQ